MRSDTWYDTAEICFNGHVSNEYSVSYPNHNKNFCDECGAKTIQKCPECEKAIRGHYHVPGVIGFSSEYTSPAFCYHCGIAFPWLKEKLDAAKEITMMIDELSPDEKVALNQSLDDLIKDSPRAPVAALRFKKLVAKASSAVGSAFRDILVDIASETAKKALWP